MSNINKRADGFPKENAGGKINTTGLFWIKKKVQRILIIPETLDNPHGLRIKRGLLKHGYGQQSETVGRDEVTNGVWLEERADEKRQGGQRAS